MPGRKRRIANDLSDDNIKKRLKRPAKAMLDNRDVIAQDRPCEKIIAMWGDLELIQSKIKELVKKLHDYRPDIRIALISHGKQRGCQCPLTRWIDFSNNVAELCQYIDSVKNTYGGGDYKSAEAVRLAARENLTATARREIFWFGAHAAGLDVETIALNMLQSSGVLKDRSNIEKNPDGADDKHVPRYAAGSTETRRAMKNVRNAKKTDKQCYKYASKVKPFRKNQTVTAKKSPKLKSTKSRINNLKTTQKKLLRERLTDAKFNVGPIKKLKWTDWFLAICNTIPRGHSPLDFKRVRNSKFFHRRDLGNKLRVEAFYEFGVKLPRNKTIVPVYYRNCFHTTGNIGVLTMYFLRNRKIRMEVERLLNNKCKLYVRRAVKRGKDNSTKWTNAYDVRYHLKKIDYAWSKHGKGGHRKLIRSKVIISDDTL